MPWIRLVLAIAPRAVLWPPLAADLLRVAFPFLPVPSRDYVRWRMQTAYGDEDAVPPAADVIRYARWVGRQR